VHEPLRGLSVERAWRRRLFYGLRRRSRGGFWSGRSWLRRSRWWQRRLRKGFDPDRGAPGPRLTILSSYGAPSRLRLWLDWLNYRLCFGLYRGCCRLVCNCRLDVFHLFYNARIFVAAVLATCLKVSTSPPCCPPRRPQTRKVDILTTRCPSCIAFATALSASSRPRTRCAPCSRRRSSFLAGACPSRRHP